MGKIAETQKHVADKHAFAADLGKPAFVFVIGVEHVVGAGIGRMVAFHVNDAEIHVRLGIGLDGAQYFRQLAGRREFLESEHAGQALQLGGALLKKDVNGAALAAGDVFHLAHGFLIVQARELDGNNHAHHQHGEDGKTEGGRKNDVPKPRVALLGCHDFPPVKFVRRWFASGRRLRAD